MATVVDIVESAVLQVRAGLDLLDSSNAFLVDISSDLEVAGSSVASDLGNTIHRTCRLVLGRELDWGAQRVRVRARLTDPDGNSQEFQLGVFVLTTPERIAGEVPPKYSVEGYDLLAVVNVPYGETLALDAGDVVLTAIADLLSPLGGVNAISQAAIASTLPAAKVWPLSQENTRLVIINELLKSIGYQALWVDRDGRWRSDPLTPDTSKPPVWVYSTESPRTTVGVKRTQVADYFDVPNRWVFINDDSPAAPTEGDGMYTVTNSSDGPTSVAGRGRTIPKVVHLTAADQAALVVQGDVIVAMDKRVTSKVSMTTAPNPTHWHDEVATLIDPDLNASGLFKVVQWKFALDGTTDTSLTLESL